MNAPITKFFLLLIIFFHTITTTMQQELREGNNSLQFYKHTFRLSPLIYALIEEIHNSFISEVNSTIIERPSFDQLLVLFNKTLDTHTINHSCLDALNAITGKQQYTFNEILWLMFASLIYSWDIDISPEECKEDFKYLIVSLTMEKFNKNPFKWCPCEKLNETDRMLGILKTVDLIKKKHPITQATKLTPLIYTSFGSGNFLHDYLTLLLLHKKGYNYFIIHFIDELYHKNTHTALQSIFKKRLKTATFDASFKFFNSYTDYLKKFKKKHFKNTILTAVDAHEYNQVPQDNIEKEATHAYIYIMNKKQEILTAFLLNLRKKLLSSASKELCPLIHYHYQQIAPKLYECLRTTSFRIQLIKEIPLLLGQLYNNSPNNYCVVWHKCQKDDFKMLKEQVYHPDILITTQNCHPLKAFYKNGITAIDSVNKRMN